MRTGCAARGADLGDNVSGADAVAGGDEIRPVVAVKHPPAIVGLDHDGVAIAALQLPRP